MFAASANQIADNAATYAQRLYSSNNKRIPDRSFYPPFSPDWCFSIDGVLTNKGASNYFYQRLDDEMLLRLQHRPKHGLFARLALHQCLSSDYIRDESLYNGLIKMTATCWTRSIYLNSTLADQTWKHWKYNLQNQTLAVNTPDTIPKGWKKNPMICNNIIRACPFCKQDPWIRKKIGNLEHLHLYCTSEILQKTRNHCYQKIEDSIGNLYSLAALLEYNCDLRDTTRYTKLQEKMIEAAKLAELKERPIVRNSHLIHEQRQEHLAIKSRHDVQLATLLHILPAEKLEEYTNFPFMAQLGLIHAIPEDLFDVASATIIDVTFLGFMPKTIFEAMRTYGYTIDRDKASEEYNKFQKLVDKLISAVVYRPITIQKAIHILIARQKNILDEMDQNQNRDTSIDQINTSIVSMRNHTSQNGVTSNSPENTESKKHACHSIKCRILYAKGIIRRPMLCLKGRNMCSGCTIESSKQRKTNQLENEMLAVKTDNNTLASLLEYRTKPCCIKKFRKLLCMLPTFQSNTRDDYIFGAVRYFANSLGILLPNSSSPSMLDEHMTSTEVRQLWRRATFFCKCRVNSPITFGVRSFCLSCSYLISTTDTDAISLCPSCNMNECWEYVGHPCLSCQFASCVFLNPFNRRFESVINTWLPIASDFGSSSESNRSNDYISENRDKRRKSFTLRNISTSDWVKLRQSNIDKSLDAMRASSRPEHNKNVFRNISKMRQTLRLPNADNTLNYDYSSPETDVPKENIIGLEYTGNTTRIRTTQGIDMKQRKPQRVALAPLKLNTITNNAPKRNQSDTEANTVLSSGPNKKLKETKWATGSSKQIRKHQRTLIKKTKNLI